MSKTKIITIEIGVDEDTIDALDEVKKQLLAGMLYGYNPNWSKHVEDEDEPLKCTHEGCRELQCADGEFCSEHIGNEKIVIPLSESDIGELQRDEEFHWTFPTNKGRSIDVHLRKEDEEGE
jgi:hypothetical protein